MNINVDSFEEEVEKIPSLISTLSPAFYIDFDKINFACQQIAKSEIRKREDFLTRIAKTMIELLKKCDDNRTQRNSFESFRNICLTFCSIEHFYSLTELVFLLLEKDYFKVYRRNACVLLTNMVKNLKDKKAVENTIERMLFLAKNEDDDGIQMDICDFIAKTSRYIRNNRLLMDIFSYFVKLINEDRRKDRFMIALKILSDLHYENEIFYEAMCKYRIANEDKCIEFISYLLPKVINFKENKLAIKCLYMINNLTLNEC